MIQIKQTKEFQVWFASLTTREQVKLEARLERIKNFEHFGDAKGIGGGLAELRWANGWRVYFVRERDYYFVVNRGT